MMQQQSLPVVKLPAYNTPACRMNTEELEEEEESGWTSYLDTECPSLSLISLTYSYADHHHHRQYNNSISSTSNINDQFNHGAPLSPHHYSNFNRHAVTQVGNVNAACSKHTYNEREKLFMDFPEEESCGSSTLSDANSPACSSPPRLIKRRLSNQLLVHQKLKRRRANNSTTHKQLNIVAAHTEDHLEDTATSTPSSNCQNYGKGRQLEVSWDCAEGDVLNKFKALEAFIPGLGEMVGTEAEEEMLNVIISHVRALELKVQFLSEVWRRAYEEKMDKSLHFVV